MPPKKDNTNCCVYGCSSRRGVDASLRFHHFPNKNTGTVGITNKFGVVEIVDKRLAWDKALLMGFRSNPSTKYMRVCSKHFKETDYKTPYLYGLKKTPCRLKATAVPSLNLPLKPNVQELIDKRRHERHERRQLLRENNQGFQEDNTLCASSCSNASDVIAEENQEDNHVPVTRLEDLNEAERAAVSGLLAMKTTVFTCEKDTQVSSGDFIVKFINTITSDSELRSLTNINSLKLLDVLSGLVTKYYPKKVVKLETKEKIVLVFMKLKLSLSYKILSFIFKVTPSLCGKIFNEYIQCLSNILKPFIPWPSIDECRRNLPLSFQDFSSVRVVVDCTEIPICRPKCLCCRVKTYSFYKGRHTIKFMTGVSPGGLLTFVSKAYGGRSSDKSIFEQSGLIQKLEPYIDNIMVDKGFLIEKVCEENNIRIFRPIFLRKKKQFTKEESIFNVKIAKARVHVERVNQRLKTFEIMNGPFPWALAKNIDDIIAVCGAMTNLQNPIMADDKFLK